MLIFSYYFSMPTKKKAPAVIKGPQFNGSTPLNHDDVDALSVDGFGSPAETLLDNINWSREIVALTGIRLTPDNLRVASSAIFLLGSLCVDKRVSVTKVWNFPTTTYITITVNNANIFTFPNGALTSDYVDSSALSFKFSQSGSSLELSSLADFGYKGFCLRAALAPISPTFSKIWITLFPFSKADLISSHPLAPNPSFPGLKILEGDIPLAPLSAGPPLEKDWGFPFAPAFLIGSELDPDAPLPSNLTIIAALTSMLRNPVRPEQHSSGAKLAARYADLLEHGSSQLKTLSTEHIWPLPLNPDAIAGPSSGTLLCSLYFPSFTALTVFLIFLCS